MFGDSEIFPKTGRTEDLPSLAPAPPPPSLLGLSRGPGPLSAQAPLPRPPSATHVHSRWRMTLAHGPRRARSQGRRLSRQQWGAGPGSSAQVGGLGGGGPAVKTGRVAAEGARGLRWGCSRPPSQGASLMRDTQRRGSRPRGGPEEGAWLGHSRM